jgi:phosphoesterase RecJ-like protein
MVLDEITDVFKKGKRFFVASHVDPDGDALGSLLALGEMLMISGKEVALYNEGPIPESLSSLPGVEKIVRRCNLDSDFDAFVILDCGNIERVGEIHVPLSGLTPLINIDHHENNSRFGDVNLVDADSSSAGEIIYRLMKAAGFPINASVAENIFVAIQTDTGSFRYDNTTTEAFATAGELLQWGVNPWKTARKVMDGSTLDKLRLLVSTLETIELYYGGKVGLVTITKRMLPETDAGLLDSERFVDYPRGIFGVEIAVLIREIKEGFYRLSLRSNDWANVAELASRLGGGGHPRAAAYTRAGNLGSVKQEFLNEARRILGCP